jgi:hypothetical protein
MKNLYFIAIIILFFISYDLHAQNSLPEISVNSFNGKVIISWLNDYSKPVTNIFIQRSYDSLKNFTTIGSVLIPQNKENGYPDNNPPYNKMYYRVSVTFEGGDYVIGPSFRPVIQRKEIPEINITDITKKIITKELFWQPLEVKEIPKPVIADSLKKNSSTDSVKKITIPNIVKKIGVQPKDSINIVIPKVIIEKTVTYPSSVVYTNKQNSITIHIPDPNNKKYQIKFFDEENNFLFQLNKLNEEYLIIEKVNFVHSGWFNFELFEDGISIEKNKFYISKDVKSGSK